MPQGGRSPADDLDRAFEIFILVILGLFMFILGSLLFAIDRGSLSYNPDSAHGLFLVVLSFQAVVLGKTPFGDFRRSWLLVIIGFCVATIGLYGSFVPGASSHSLRILVGVILLPVGVGLCAQLWLSKQKARTWPRSGGH